MFLSTEGHPPNSRKEEAELDRKLDAHIESLHLQPRTSTILMNAGLERVRQLLRCRSEDLMELDNFAEKSLEDTFEKLQRAGFYRDGHEPPEQLEATERSNEQLTREADWELAQSAKSKNGRGPRKSHMSQSQKSMELTLGQLLYGKE